MYYRLMLPDLLQVQKVIYLDCDILVEADISALWNCEINQFGCAGTDEHSEWHSNRLQLSDGIYVNSGVLVLNLDFCRRHHFLQKCITWVTVNSPKLMFPDQDAINVILAGHKALLPSHFNLNPLSLSKPEDLKNIPNRILHFSGSAKPWHRYYQFEFQTLYRKYLEYTPWINEFKPLEPVSYGQALAAANQYFEKKDMQNAAIYYWQSMKFYLNDHKVESIFMLEVLNVAIDLFRREKHLDSATLFRTCLKQWGLPIDHMFNIYKYPGFLNG
jgi:lipopolysaccharide biosynthesis glycosyltransferase